MNNRNEATTEVNRTRALADAARARRFRFTRSGLVSVSALGAIAIVAAACSSSPSTSNTSQTTSPTTTGSSAGASSTTSGGASASTATVKTAQSPQFGTILVNQAGMALYTFGGDHGGQSACTGACAQAWPALTVPSGTTPTAASGVTGTLGTSRQSNGSLQVTYNGALLYTFVSDSSPGQVTGNGVANFSVAKVSSSASGAGASNTTPTTRGGSGY
jgi:predicted lipoprotein with Yx(FWY)xxD motif